MNGNLLTASPHIAVKLSGSKAFYRAAFILAFYSHDVVKMFDLYELHSLAPMLDLPLSSWAIRSMTHAVLGSSWCTWGYVRRWHANNLGYAASLLTTAGKPLHRGDSILRFWQGQTSLESLLGGAWHVKDDEGRCWQLETSIWDIRLTRESDVIDDDVLYAEEDQDFEQDPYTAEWRHELVFHCQMRIYGVVTIGDEKTQYYELEDHQSFRNMIGQFTGFNIEEVRPRSASVDFWQLLEERAIRATRNIHWLRETVAIDYFLSPEDKPFQISPSLYRVAAAVDLRLEPQIFATRLSYMPALHVLFAIDPLSLPRKDLAILDWTTRAKTRLVNFYSRLGTLHDQLKGLQLDRGGPVRNRELYKLHALQLEHEYNYEIDWQIVHYVTTGTLLVAPPNAISPDFSQPLQWLGERLMPSFEALDNAESITRPHAKQRDLDIFGDEYEHYMEHYCEVDTMFCEQNLSKLFKLEEGQVEWASFMKMLRSSPEEARYALTTPDPYYESLDHDDYGILFPDNGRIDEGRRGFYSLYSPSEADEGEDQSEDWDEDQTEDWSEDHGANMQADSRVNTSSIVLGGLLQDEPTVVDRDLSLLIIPLPDEDHPLPPKDTEVADRIEGPPAWFRAVEEPCFITLGSHGTSTRFQA